MSIDYETRDILVRTQLIVSAALTQTQLNRPYDRVLVAACEIICGLETLGDDINAQLMVEEEDLAAMIADHPQP